RDGLRHRHQPDRQVPGRHRGGGAHHDVRPLAPGCGLVPQAGPRTHRPRRRALTIAQAPEHAPDTPAEAAGPEHGGPPPAGVAADGSGGGSAGGFTVELENFSGPFDVLLDLIARRSLDITEIALAEVTDDFLAHVATLRGTRGLDELSHFLLVAAKIGRASCRASNYMVEEAVASYIT